MGFPNRLTLMSLAGYCKELEGRIAAMEAIAEPVISIPTGYVVPEGVETSQELYSVEEMAGEPYTIVHKGFGNWFAVNAAGVKANEKALSKEEATALAVQLNEATEPMGVAELSGIPA